MVDVAFVRVWTLWRRFVRVCHLGYIISRMFKLMRSMMITTWTNLKASRLCRMYRPLVLPHYSQHSIYSSWLVALPIQKHGFSLHKSAFQDALCLHYGWQPSLLLSACVCGHAFTTDHALNCHMGGFPTICHNEVRDLTANLLTEVYDEYRSISRRLYGASPAASL